MYACWIYSETVSSPTYVLLNSLINVSVRFKQLRQFTKIAVIFDLTNENIAK